MNFPTCRCQSLQIVAKRNAGTVAVDPLASVGRPPTSSITQIYGCRMNCIFQSDTLSETPRRRYDPPRTILPRRLQDAYRLPKGIMMIIVMLNAQELSAPYKPRLCHALGVGTAVSYPAKNISFMPSSNKPSAPQRAGSEWFQNISLPSKVMYISTH